MISTFQYEMLGEGCWIVSLNGTVLALLQSWQLSTASLNSVVRNIQIHGSHIQLGMKHIIKVILTGPSALIHHANAIITHRQVHRNISTLISTLA